MTEPAQRDRTLFYGIWALVGSVFCLPLGIIMIVLSYQEARRNGRFPTLAYIAAALLVVFTVINIRFVLSGDASRYFKQ
jgi:hypothetical protein